MKRFFRALLLLIGIAGRLHAQDIYTYTNSTAGVPVYVDPLIPTYSNLTPIGTGFTTACGSGFSGIDGFTGTSYTSSGPCIEISLTAMTGYNITATGFTAGLRNSPTGPIRARMAYSTDGTIWIDEGIDHIPFLSGSCATSTAGTTLASWTSFTVTSPTLYFRIYPFSAPGAGGTIQVYGLDIIGSVNLACTAPVVSVTPSLDSFCRGTGGVSLTASGAGTGGVYIWSPSGSLSSGAGTTVTATPAVTTTYTVIGINAGGCRDTTTATVKVMSLPVAGITAAGPVTFCPGNSVLLTATSGSGFTYQWSRAGTPISGATDNTYTASLAGNYTVTVTNSNGCVATSAPTVVTWLPAPASTLIPAGPTTYCQGGSVLLTAASGAGYTYQWYSGSTLLTASGATYLATASGVIKAIVTNPAGCTTVSTAVLVTEVDTPYIMTSGATTFCAGNNTVLTVNLSGASGVTYQWLNNGHPIAGANSGIYVANSAGIYSCYVVIGAGTCSDTTGTVTVTVHPAPHPTVAYNGAVFSTGYSYATYQWFLNTVAIPGATSYTWRPMIGGSYNVRVVDANGCSAYSNAYVIYSVGVENTISGDLVIKIFPNPAENIVHIDAPVKVRAVISGMQGNAVIVREAATDLDISALPSGMYMIALFDQEGQRIAIEKLVKQ